MPGKRKGFSYFSTIAFWALTLVVFAAIVALGIYEMTYSEKRYYDHLTNYDSIALSVKQQIAALSGSKDSVVAKNKYPVITGDEYHPTEIHDSLFSFEINYDSIKNGAGEWDNFIKSVHIIRLTDHKKIQTIVPSEIYRFESYHVPVVVEDMNFDGYYDLRILNFVPMYACETYYYWLYMPEKKRFEKNKPLEVTSNVKFDKSSNTVTSHFRGGGPFDQRNEIFIWEKDNLSLQYSEEVFMGIKNMEGTFTMKKRIDGKLFERSRQYDSIPIATDGTLYFIWDSLK